MKTVKTFEEFLNESQNINNDQYYDIEIPRRDSNHISVKNIPSDIDRKKMIRTIDTLGDSVLETLEENLNYDFRGTISSDKGGLKIKEFTIQMGEEGNGDRKRIEPQKVHITFRDEK